LGGIAGDPGLKSHGDIDQFTCHVSFFSFTKRELE
jgi:hypothetical protein